MVSVIWLLESSTVTGVLGFVFLDPKVLGVSMYCRGILAILIEVDAVFFSWCCLTQ